ncbi:MAG: PIN domain-containing protein [Gammaproteobacteria bacterium]|nr:PIN domain-containing protein [Gammaproteobacteria bacterium]
MHSIGVILFRHGRARIFSKFVTDVLSKINIVTLSRESYEKLPDFGDEYGLDFDDAYQCKVAEERGLTVITMDKDFRSVKDRIEVEFM